MLAKLVSLMTFRRGLAAAAFTTLTFIAMPAWAVTIDTVVVGAPGNAAYNGGTYGGIGAVAYTYEIGTTEVTNQQYTDFLNAVATEIGGPYEDLWDTQMGTDTNAYILRSTNNGLYEYTTLTPTNPDNPPNANSPVNLVSVRSAARFANWMHQGQPTASPTLDLDTGSYTIDSVNSTITRQTGATYVLPNQDEWFKAAYYDPTGGTWNSYANSQNMVPTLPSGAGPAYANYNSFASPAIMSAESFPGTVTEFGSLNMNGNVGEITETGTGTGNNFHVFGGDFFSLASDLERDGARYALLSFDGTGSNGLADNFGFRLVVIPEPSTALLLLIPGAVLALRRRRAA